MFRYIELYIGIFDRILFVIPKPRYMGILYINCKYDSDLSMNKYERLLNIMVGIFQNSMQYILRKRNSSLLVSFRQNKLTR